MAWLTSPPQGIVQSDTTTIDKRNVWKVTDGGRDDSGATVTYVTKIEISETWHEVETLYPAMTKTAADALASTLKAQSTTTDVVVNRQNDAGAYSVRHVSRVKTDENSKEIPLGG